MTIKQLSNRFLMNLKYDWIKGQVQKSEKNKISLNVSLCRCVKANLLEIVEMWRRRMHCTISVKRFANHQRFSFQLFEQKI